MRRKSKERDWPISAGDKDAPNMMEYDDDEHEQFARPSPRPKKLNLLKILILLTVGIVLIVVIIGITSWGSSQPEKTNLVSETPAAASSGPFHAFVLITVGDTGVRIGSLSFSQETNGGPVTITGEVSGLPPNTKHGFHVHIYGDFQQGCNSTGLHFNPFNKKHGAPTDEERHVGDLGNIDADDKGIAKVQITDRLISLAPGVTCIIGRSLVLHARVDDLGRGGTPDSLTTGNAGLKYACGVIGFAP